ncbi:carboxylate--amine ligase, partial [Rhodococcus hoagii]|nr:carboxylate--amine ligase [Prescottella equi]
MGVPFAGSPRPTIGVEWEIALVDRTTRDLSNTAAEVFDAVGGLADER